MTETKMEVIKLMPKEYTRAEANAFKHGFFLGAKSEKEELIKKAVEYIITNIPDMHTLGVSAKMDECIIKDFRKYMEGE